MGVSASGGGVEHEHEVAKGRFQKERGQYTFAICAAIVSF